MSGSRTLTATSRPRGCRGPDRRRPCLRPDRAIAIKDAPDAHRKGSLAQRPAISQRIVRAAVARVLTLISPNGVPRGTRQEDSHALDAIRRAGGVVVAGCRDIVYGRRSD